MSPKIIPYIELMRLNKSIGIFCFYDQLISAISEREIVAALYNEGSVDGELFSHFMENYLGPKLKKGKQLIMHNVSFHKVKGIEEIVRSYGENVVYCLLTLQI